MEKSATTSSTREPAREAVPIDELSTIDLLSRGLEEAKELTRTEVALARAEGAKDLRAAVRSVAYLGVAAAAAILALALFLVAIVLALGGAAGVAAALGAGFVVLTGVVGAAGYAALPKQPLEQTRRDLADDARSVKEHAP